MDLDDLLKEYWPIVVGVVVVLVMAIVLWPSDEPGMTEPSLDPVVVSPMTDAAKRALLQQQAKEAVPELHPQDRPPADGPQNPSEEYEFLEIVEAVPLADSAGAGRNFKTDDPEVQRALKKVEVTLYQEKECASCSAARAYLEQNGISVTMQSVDDDSNQRERARRLSGGRALPVLVVDGKVLQGFSEDAVQAALLSAVKSRVEAEVQTKSGL